MHTMMQGWSSAQVSDFCALHKSSVTNTKIQTDRSVYQRLRKAEFHKNSEALWITQKWDDEKVQLQRASMIWSNCTHHDHSKRRLTDSKRVSRLNATKKQKNISTRRQVVPLRALILSQRRNIKNNSYNNLSPHTNCCKLVNVATSITEPVAAYNEDAKLKY